MHVFDEDGHAVTVSKPDLFNAVSLGWLAGYR